MRQIKLAIRQLFGAGKYGASYHIVSLNCRKKVTPKGIKGRVLASNRAPISANPALYCGFALDYCVEL